MASVDVAIPCYQYGRYLRDCVTSVLRQEVSDLRVLIIDNASTDESVQVARQLAAEDSRVELIEHATNLGPHASYNEAIDWAQSDYFLLLDADDIVLEGAIERAVSFMEMNRDVAFTYGWVCFIGEDGKFLSAAPVDEAIDWKINSGADFIKEFCARGFNVIAASTVIRRTSVQKKAGYYRPELPYTDDVELWLRLATLGKVACSGQRQAGQRYHADRASNYYTDRIERDFLEREAAFKSFFLHEGRVLGNRASLRAHAKRSLAAHAYWSSVSQLLRGNVRSSLRLLQFAFARRPSLLLAPPIVWLFRRHQLFAHIRAISWEPINWLFSVALKRDREMA